MIAVELTKQARRLRTYVALGVMVAIPVVITVATALDKGGGDNDPSPQAQLFRMITTSGLNVPLPALLAMSHFLLVVVVALFAGDAVAGEAGWGTLSYLLVRPVRRSRLLAAKLSVAALLALVATVLVALAALVAGTVAFGWHPMASPLGGHIAQLDAVGRIGLATLYVAWCMAGTLALAFMLSTMTDSGAGAVAIAVGVAVVSQILDTINSLRDIQPALISHYWEAWITLFLPHASRAGMVKGVLLQVAYVTVFCGVAWWWFGRKDILS